MCFAKIFEGQFTSLQTWWGKESLLFYALDTVRNLCVEIINSVQCKMYGMSRLYV